MDYALNAANELEAAILTSGADNIAAFICETVVGSSLGAVAALPGYLQRIRDICDQYDVLLILDEIMCGSGRTGTYFSFEQDAVIPDIVTLAKGIAGGYQPLAATIMRAPMAEVFNQSGFCLRFVVPKALWVRNASTCFGCSARSFVLVNSAMSSLVYSLLSTNDMNSRKGRTYPDLLVGKVQLLGSAVSSSL